MKITVVERGSPKIHLHLPTGLLCNRFVAQFIPLAARDHIPISRQQAVALVKAINSFRRQHPGWTLVEVDAADGSRICITL